MEFLTISKILLIALLPIVLFLLVLDFASFDETFYKEKFSEYGVQKIVPNTILLHEKVIKFISGKNIELPNEFNEREKQHLMDVRKAVNYSTILLYALIAMFIILLVISAFTLKVSNYITSFVGKVLVFGGFLTIILSAMLFFLIYFDFSSAFENFHLMLFEKGTYTFDPAKEMIVRLYPERLFMDLGLRISKFVFFTSIFFILIGGFLIFKSKKQKH